MEKQTNATVACHPESGSPDVTGSGTLPAAVERRAYTAPCLERLGVWSALTLQQSVPIFP